MKFAIGLLCLAFAQSGTHSMAADLSKVVILDVRTPAEYKENHLQNAVQIDFKEPDFKEKIQQLDKSKTYKVYCRSGNRSGQAIQLMKSLGFRDVENMGSISEAAKKLNQKCEGEKPC